MGKQERPANPSHDVSAWKQVVVGTDEFSPAAPRSRAGLWIAVAIVVAAAAGIAIIALR